MRSFSLFLFSMCILLFNCKSSNSMESTVSFLGSSIEFASKTEAAQLLGTSDAFSESMSAFDFSAKNENPFKNTEKDYLLFAAEQAKEWSTSDINDTKEVMKKIEEKVLKLGLKLKLPNTITLVLSTCAEEGGAEGYTRENYIVFKNKPSEHLFLHELWHIISRENQSLRDAAYEIIGFKKTGRIQFPAELESLRITNPDAPFIEHTIDVEIGDETKEVAICTMASAPYSEGSFFKYLMIVLYEATSIDGQMTLISSPPYAIDKVQGFREKIGNNTNYIIHPEEITAEHFTMMVMESDVKSQQQIDELKALLQK